MTNKEANAAARRIPFSADTTLPADVKDRLEHIVNRQALRTITRSNGRRDNLRIVTGVDVPYGANRKAPGHDAAVKAGKARVADNYDMAAAGDATVEANYQADKAAYYRGRGR